MLNVVKLLVARAPISPGTTTFRAKLFQRLSEQKAVSATFCCVALLSALSACVPPKTDNLLQPVEFAFLSGCCCCGCTCVRVRVFVVIYPICLLFFFSLVPPFLFLAVCLPCGGKCIKNTPRGRLLLPDPFGMPTCRAKTSESFAVSLSKHKRKASENVVVLRNTWLAFRVENAWV